MKAVSILFLVFSLSLQLSAQSNGKKNDKNSSKVTKLSDVPAEAPAAQTNVNKEPDFEKAVMDGDVKKINKLLDRGVSVDYAFTMDVFETTALTESVRQKNYPLFKSLLKKGANPNGAKNGYVPLIQALQLEQGKMVDDILKNDLTDVNRVEETNLSALMVAAQKQNVEALKKILRRGAVINMSDSNYRTALWFAVDYGCLDCIAPLMKHGANPQISNQKGVKLIDSVPEGARKEEFIRLLTREKAS